MKEDKGQREEETPFCLNMGITAHVFRQLVLEDIHNFDY